ncbi:MAG: hypothetical protein ACXWKG_11690 [Limisphaerales bacterium]
MKPSPINYIFARDWPLKGYLSAWAILGVVIVVSVCQPSRAMFSDWTFCLLFFLSLLIAPVLFGFLSLPMAFMVLGPIYFLGGRLAGAPFRAGDRVRILVGPHRDRVVEIYDVWDSRRQVRVHLDAQSEKDVRDVFSFTQVFREHR